MIEIATMTPADIEFVVEMSHIEHWRHSEADIARLLSFAPGGCFVAWEGAQRAGTVSTTRYGDFAFLSVLIVPEQFRNRGVGRKLMEHAIAYLQAEGAKTIELDGVLRAVPLYRRLGFRKKYYSLRFRGPAPDCGKQWEKYRPTLREEILAFERERIPLDRNQVIERFLTEFANTTYLLRDSRLRAYCSLRPRVDDSLSLGPLVADNLDSATVLLESVLSDCRGRKVRIGVPKIHSRFAVRLKKLGFGQGEPSLRMYLGERRDYEQHAFGIISAEKS